MTPFFDRQLHADGWRFFSGMRPESSYVFTVCPDCARLMELDPLECPLSDLARMDSELFPLCR